MQFNQDSQRISLDPGHWHLLSMGDLSLYLQRKGSEYLAATEYQSPALTARCEALKRVNCLPSSVDVKERIYFGDTEDTLSISLQLSDKPYQVNPSALVTIAPKGRLVLYVSTPLWVQLKSIETGKVQAEYPTVIPRMSWVGSNTTEGSLCYSTKTAAPSDFKEVKHYNHRALTALELINDGEHQLHVDRLSLPLNLLSLYYSKDNGFWTESVRYRINPTSKETSVVASKRPPEEVGECLKISNARSSKKVSRFKTAMNLIMG